MPQVVEPHVRETGVSCSPGEVLGDGLGADVGAVRPSEDPAVVAIAVYEDGPLLRLPHFDNEQERHGAGAQVDATLAAVCLRLSLDP